MEEGNLQYACHLVKHLKRHRFHVDCSLTWRLVGSTGHKTGKRKHTEKLMRICSYTLFEYGIWICSINQFVSNEWIDKAFLLIRFGEYVSILLLNDAKIDTIRIRL